jgi:hypothetical protein
MIIEFFGFPGVGKTYVTKIINEKINQSNIDLFFYPYRSKMSKFLNILYYSISNLQIVTSLFILSLSNTGNRWFSLIRFLKVVVFLTNYEKNRKYNAQTVILDQGIFQAVWSIFSNSKNPNFNQEKFSKIICKLSEDYNHYIIYLKKDIESIILQLKSRPNQHTIFEKMDNNELFQLYSNQERIFISIIEDISKDRCIILCLDDFKNEEEIINYLITNVNFPGIQNHSSHISGDSQRG